MSASTGGGGGWASDTAGSNTARGTGYSQLDNHTRPYITNANSITNCFNAATNYGPVSANQGTYLGTIYATANGQTTYSFGANGAPPTPGMLGVWNAYNQIDVSTTFVDTTGSWAYSSATNRAPNGDTSTYRVSFVSGIAQQAIKAAFTEPGQPQTSSTASGLSNGLALDSTSSPNFAIFAEGGNVAVNVVSPQVVGSFPPQIGFHFISATESATNGLSMLVFGSGPGLTTSFRM